MYRYPPTLAELPHGEAERAVRIVAYLHDEVSVVVEVFGADGLLIGRTIATLSGCLEVTTGLVLDRSPLEYLRAPQQRTLGGQPALSGAVGLRHAQRV